MRDLGDKRYEDCDSVGGPFTLVAVSAPGRGSRTEPGGATAHDPLAFERLLAELAVRAVNVPADQVDEAIRDALRQIGEALDLDRCAMYRVEGDDGFVDFLSWERAGIQPLPASAAVKDRLPWTLEAILAGNVVCVASADEVPHPADRASYQSSGTPAAVAVPLLAGGRVSGAVSFEVVRDARSWQVDEVHRLCVMGTAVSSLLARRQDEEALQRTVAEGARLRDRLHAEHLLLRSEARDRGNGVIVGRSPALRAVMEQIERVAATDSTVLLLGETGTGKELLAAQIHALSARRGHAMVRVNCSALPATLIESELFGRERGAFTGALARQIGRFELADKSTLFLDEIGELPMDVQVKLLRVLEERHIERLGSPAPIAVDVRIIAATHRHLEQRIAEGGFREDLFYRLSVFPVRVPPLRERAEDIPLLVWRFVEEFARTFGKRIEAIPRDTMEALQRHAWPGNIRELRNVVERAMIVANDPRLTIDLPAAAPAAAAHSGRLTDVERDHIRAVLERTGWRIRGADGAANVLGLKPTTLETRIAKLGLSRPKAG